MHPFLLTCFTNVTLASMTEKQECIPTKKIKRASKRNNCCPGWVRSRHNLSNNNNSNSKCESTDINKPSSKSKMKGRQFKLQINHLEDIQSEDSDIIRSNIRKLRYDAMIQKYMNNNVQANEEIKLAYQLEINAMSYLVAFLCKSRGNKKILSNIPIKKNKKCNDYIFNIVYNVSEEEKDEVMIKETEMFFDWCNIYRSVSEEAENEVYMVNKAERTCQKALDEKAMWEDVHRIYYASYDESNISNEMETYQKNIIALYKENGNNEDASDARAMASETRNNAMVHWSIGEYDKARCYIDIGYKLEIKAMKHILYEILRIQKDFNEQRTMNEREQIIGDNIPCITIIDDGSYSNIEKTYEVVDISSDDNSIYEIE